MESWHYRLSAEDAKAVLSARRSDRFFDDFVDGYRAGYVGRVQLKERLIWTDASINRFLGPGDAFAIHPENKGLLVRLFDARRVLGVERDSEGFRSFAGESLRRRRITPEQAEEAKTLTTGSLRKAVRKLEKRDAWNKESERIEALAAEAEGTREAWKQEHEEFLRKNSGPLRFANGPVLDRPEFRKLGGLWVVVCPLPKPEYRDFVEVRRIDDSVVVRVGKILAVGENNCVFRTGSGHLGQGRLVEEHRVHRWTKKGERFLTDADGTVIDQ